MKINIASVFIIMIMFISACEKNDESGNFSAIVIENVNSQSITCSEEVWILKITGGTDRAYTIASGDAGQDADSLFAALNLPETLRIPGKNIQLEIRTPGTNEIPGCYNFEMPVILAVPYIYVLSAKEK